MLVFRDQGIGPEAQIAFGKLWGKPAQQGNPLLKDLFVTPEIIKITKIPKETASTEAWHYDSCYTPVPAQDLDPCGRHGPARRRHHVVQSVRSL